MVNMIIAAAPDKNDFPQKTTLDRLKSTRYIHSIIFKRLFHQTSF